MPLQVGALSYAPLILSLLPPHRGFAKYLRRSAVTRQLKIEVAATAEHAMDGCCDGVFAVMGIHFLYISIHLSISICR